MAESLHRLLDKGSTWNWTKNHDKCFQVVKNLSTSDSVLHPFDDKLPTTLTCDASPLLGPKPQKDQKGKELTPVFALRTLTTIEQNSPRINLGSQKISSLSTRKFSRH